MTDQNPRSQRLLQELDHTSGWIEDPPAPGTRTRQRAAENSAGQAQHAERASQSPPAGRGAKSNRYSLRDTIRNQQDGGSSRAERREATTAGQAGRAGQSAAAPRLRLRFRGGRASQFRSSTRSQEDLNPAKDTTTVPSLSADSTTSAFPQDAGPNLRCQNGPQATLVSEKPEVIESGAETTDFASLNHNSNVRQDLKKAEPKTISVLTTKIEDASTKENLLRVTPDISPSTAPFSPLSAELTPSRAAPQDTVNTPLKLKFSAPGSRPSIPASESLAKTAPQRIVSLKIRQPSSSVQPEISADSPDGAEASPSSRIKFKPLQSKKQPTTDPGPQTELAGDTAISSPPAQAGATSTMPEMVDPAALSRPISSTPILPPKTISSISSAQKLSKSSHVPPRIDLEPLYAQLKAACGDGWGTYKEALGLLISGLINETEFSRRTARNLNASNEKLLHYHNHLLSAIFSNVTREMPDQAVASWVSANDKPAAGAGNKPLSGDPAEQRLKYEVMQLPAKDRRRYKEIAQSEYSLDFNDAFASLLGEDRRSKFSKGTGEAVAASAGGLNRTNLTLEERKEFSQILAQESGEFPDATAIESRMTPKCHQAGLINAPDTAQFLANGTEHFIREFLSEVFSKTRTNGPGAGGSAGSGGASAWVKTQKYQIQLDREEELALRGEIQRDKTGLLPVEARTALERRPLGTADLLLALELGDCKLGTFAKKVQMQLMHGYREGELEDYNKFTRYEDGRFSDFSIGATEDTVMGGTSNRQINGNGDVNGINGHHNDDDEDDDDEEAYGWIGGTERDRQHLMSVLDSVL